MKHPRPVHSILILVLSLLGFTHCLAQKKIERDSLMRIVANTSEPDTSKALAGIALAEYYRFINIDSANISLEKGIAIAREKKFSKAEGYGFNIKGLLSKDQSKTDEAIQYFNMSADFFRKAGDSLRLGNIYNNIGLVWYDVGNIAEAEKNFNRALQIFQSANSLKGTGITFINFGQINRKHGLYFTALDYYFKALQIFEKHAISEEQLANTYGNIGTVYNHLEKYDEAILFQDKAIRIFEKLNQLTKLNVVKINMATMYLQVNQFDKAEKNAQDAVDYFKTNKRTRLVIAGQIILISSALKQKKSDRAMSFVDEASELLKTITDPETEATLLNNKAEVYFLKQRYHEAQKLAEKANSICKTNHFLELEKETSKLLSDIFTAEKDYKSAYTYLTAYSALKDSTFNKGKLNQLFELEKKYELDKKQSQLDLLTSQNEVATLQLTAEKRARIQLIAGLGVLLLLSLVIYMGYRTKSRLNIQLGNQNEEITTQNELIESINKELQARALRAQMNPHFIFNSLSSIQYLIIKNKSEHAFDYLSQFATLLRQVMENSEKNWITVSQEIEILELYLALEKLRFSNSFEYTIERFPETASMQLPPLLIQPYVENAIVHGLLPKEHNRKLKIRFAGNDNQLLCEIEDNGIGREAAKKVSSQKNGEFASRGMNYTDERMRVLNAITGMQSNIEIIDLMADKNSIGTLVRITVTQP